MVIMENKLNGLVRITFSAIALLVASISDVHTAHACLMSPGSDVSAYLAYGASSAFQGRTLALRQNAPDGTFGYATAVVINEYTAITSGHLTKNQMAAGDTFSVSTDLNYITTTNWIPVARVIVHPLYDGTRNTPDIAVLQFIQPLVGVTRATFGSTYPGQIVKAAGYGFAFRQGEPTIPRDGFRRGWDGEVKNSPPTDSSPIYYQSTIFGYTIPLEGKILNGDSGGPVFNSQGELIGLNTAQSGNGAYAGSSIFLNLSQPAVYNFIALNTLTGSKRIQSPAIAAANTWECGLNNQHC